MTMGLIPIRNTNDNVVAPPNRTVVLSASVRLVLISIANRNKVRLGMIKYLEILL